MMISEQQVQRVAGYLRDRSQDVVSPHSVHAVPVDVLERAFQAAINAPDPRPGRVEEARKRMDTGEPDADAIAARVLSRLMCDSIR